MPDPRGRPAYDSDDILVIEKDGPKRFDGEEQFLDVLLTDLGRREPGSSSW
jgi:hypothetical protein